MGPLYWHLEYLPMYSGYQKIRHNVRPGITGWAQVNGRNAISWEEKFSLDVWYVENQSLFLDMKIVILTLFKIFQSSGINSSKGLTSKPFQGNKYAK